MSDNFKISPSLLNQKSQLEQPTPKNEIRYLDGKNPNEVYRNNTTAVEVIIKRIKNKNIKENELSEEKDVDCLYREIERLKMEVNSANRNLEITKKCFKIVMFEMGKQLELANQRELKRQTRNLILQLEKEKCKSILASKTNLVSKMSRELLNMKRIIKMLSKSIKSIAFVSETTQSDSEYAEFESDLLKGTEYRANATDDPITCDTTASSK